MAKFFTTDYTTFNADMIVQIEWNMCVEVPNSKEITTITCLNFIDGSELYLYYNQDIEYFTINDLREYLHLEKLPRLDLL